MSYPIQTTTKILSVHDVLVDQFTAFGGPHRFGIGVGICYALV